MTFMASWTGWQQDCNIIVHVGMLEITWHITAWLPVDLLKFAQFVLDWITHRHIWLEYMSTVQTISLSICF